MEQTQRLVPATTHAAAQLVELGNTEMLGFAHHHHRCIRYIDTDLDDRRGDEHIDLSGAELGHDPVLVLAFHAAVQNLDPQALQLHGL